MRRGFTLIELLVIIGIMGLMVTVGIVSVRTGKGAARVKGATRDVFAAIRHARSTALVTGKPTIITYSMAEEDGEPVTKVEITSAKLFDSSFDRSRAQTLTGGPLLDEKPPVAEESSVVKSADGTTAAASEGEGQTLEEILFMPVDADIVRGMRIKVVVGDAGEPDASAARPSKISVFSNVDYLLGRYKEAKAKAKAEEQSRSAATDETTTPAVEEQEPVSVVWETNGRVEPHQVWIYPDGKTPEEGLSIKIDRFGAAKVLSGDGREE